MEDKKAGVLASLAGRAEKTAQESEFGMALLRGLQGKSMYEGTASRTHVEKQRAKNRRAAASRRDSHRGKK